MCTTTTHRRRRCQCVTTEGFRCKLPPMLDGLCCFTHARLITKKRQPIIITKRIEFFLPKCIECKIKESRLNQCQNCRTMCCTNCMKSVTRGRPNMQCKYCTQAGIQNEFSIYENYFNVSKNHQFRV